MINMMLKLIVICLVINSVITNVHSCPSGSSKTLPKCDEYTYKKYVDRSSILSDIPDTRQIGHLSLTGTHNSMSYTTPNPEIQTQELNITEQFKHGIRVFEIGIRTVLNYFTIYSGTASMHRTLSDILHDLNKCLDDYPREFVILILYQEYKARNDDLHPNNCKILEGYLTNNEGSRLVKNWTLSDTIDKVRGKILLTTRDVSFINCLYELFSRCSLFGYFDPSTKDNELSIIDTKWNEYLKFVENQWHLESKCFIYNMSVFDKEHYFRGAAKYGGYSFNNTCVLPINYRIDVLYPGSQPKTMNIYILDYMTQNAVDHIHEVNLLNVL
ncbi:uncharacterized protein LOC103579856 [Microplitis demolitor]|uniref:uncharacterized protein LOC103579856 n=1 Tax=Microplitis demolitor TaxID=69319 RepID=UPI0004CCC3A4|nr:uncharacterized protein LOC103579856 [Microplitis demolitor]